MNKLKEGYKVARRQMRLEKKARGKLINRLINLKTWMRYDCLYNIEREQYQYLLSRAKSWDGDVLSYFMSHYPNFNRPHPFVSHYGNRYISPEVRAARAAELEDVDLPF